jgi:hypothetical protein
MRPLGEHDRLDRTKREHAPQMGQPGWFPDHTAEWRDDYKRTTPGQRVAVAIELSRFQTQLGGPRTRVE